VVTQQADVVVDIGGTKVLVVLVQDGKVLERSRLASSGVTDPWSLVSAVAGCARELAGPGGRPVGRVLVASPGAIDRPRGVVVEASNLPFRDFPLTSALSSSLGGAEVVLEHDVMCGTIGEASYGAARGAGDVVYLTLSTGISMGALVGGRPLMGWHGWAGELGHVPVVRDGRRCGCGARGCLEAYASGRAIGLLGQELLTAGGGCLLRSTALGPAAVTAADVVAAAERGDEGCRGILNRAAGLVGDAVGLVRRILDPEVVVLGGGLMSSITFGDAVLAAATRATAGAATVSVVRAMLGEDSVIMGGMRLLAGGTQTCSVPEKGEL
jgi:glucokinase